MLKRAIVVSIVHPLSNCHIIIIFDNVSNLTTQIEGPLSNRETSFDVGTILKDKKLVVLKGMVQ